jgi:hypothetical protein
MLKLFIESAEFTHWMADHLDDVQYARLQRTLSANPDAGAVMKGCGGLRKVRIADPARGKGKRGGARIIYLHVPEANWIYLIDVYDKNKKDDLSADERKVLKRLADNFKLEAVRSLTKRNKP